MKRKPRAEPPPFGGNPEARAPTSRSQTGLPHRDVEQPCFFLPERAVRPTKKAPEGLRDPPGRGSGVRARCRQHHACAQHQVCQPAAGAHRTASLNLFPLPLFHPASSVFCAVPPVFFSPLYHNRAVICQRAEGNVPLCRLRLL